MGTISLQIFLRTGTLGPIHLGMSRDEVRGRLGEPDAMGGTSRQYRTPSLWKYGDIELIYGRHYADPLSGILMDGFELPVGGPQLALDPWILRGGMSLEEAGDHLRVAGIAYSREPWPAYDDGVSLVTAGHVQIGFLLNQEDYAPPPGLFYISRSTVFPP
jgi:hypothetical protein